MKNKKLKKVMIDKDVRLCDLSDKTGVTYQQVSRILNGSSNGSLKWWRKAAEVLNVDISEIME